MSRKTTITVGATDFDFTVDNTDINAYMNENAQSDRIAPAFNLLIRTVDVAQRDAFKTLLVTDNVPNGFLVMQIIGVLVAEASGDMQVTVKKPKGSPRA